MHACMGDKSRYRYSVGWQNLLSESGLAEQNLTCKALDTTDLPLAGSILC